MPSAPTPDDILGPFPLRVREIANRVRRVIARAVPTLVERALPGWRAIGFRDPHAGHLCALFPSEDQVRLYLEFGARLPDPEGLLEGTTRQTRYVTWRSGRQLRARALTRLLQRAVSDQSTARAARRTHVGVGIGIGAVRSKRSPRRD